MKTSSVRINSTTTARHRDRQGCSVILVPAVAVLALLLRRMNR